MNEIKELRDFIFILCLALVVMGLLTGSTLNDNTKLTESNQNYQDSIAFLDSSLTATTRLYQIHAQVNLKYSDKVCVHCRSKMRDDNEYMRLINKID